MSTDHSAAPNPEGPPPNQASRRRWWRIGLLVLALWALAAYILVPWAWKVHFQRHPLLEGFARVTTTSDGHPGDPVNLALVGSESDVIRAMTAAGWFPADPITFSTSVKIAVDSVFRRPDENAPVSNLYLFGRKQDLAFEQPVGNSPRQRHHVRFWRSPVDLEGRTTWAGAATFDDRVGLSYTTGQVTHHIGPDVDAERDRIAAELQKAGWLAKLSWVDGFHRQLEGRNGGGDPWRTDGRLAVLELKVAPAELPSKTDSPPHP